MVINKLRDNGLNLNKIQKNLNNKYKIWLIKGKHINAIFIIIFPLTSNK